MAIRARDASPQTYARVGGLLYLFIIVVALFGEVFVRERLIVRGDPAATARSIRESETLFRLSVAGDALVLVSDVAVAMILYVLLKPVDPNLSLLAAFLRLAYASVNGVFRLFQLAAVVVLGGAAYLKAFDPRQVNVLALLALRLHGQGYGISLIFFGFSCVLLGYLISRSGYLPRSIGVLLVVAGLGYLINSFAQILAPEFAATLFPWILLPAVPAEWGLCLWLIVKGVDMPKWEERARG